jgi:hypothetical protein
VTDCGHFCCRVRDNAYHGHLSTPGRCELCETALQEEEAEGLEQMNREVGLIVARVLPHLRSARR